MEKDNVYKVLEESIDDFMQWFKGMEEEDMKRSAEKYAEIGEAYVIEGVKVVLPEESGDNGGDK